MEIRLGAIRRGKIERYFGVDSCVSLGIIYWRVPHEKFVPSMNNKNTDP